MRPNVDLKRDRLVSGCHDFKAVWTRLERNPLVRVVELINVAGIVAVDVDGRIPRRDVQTYASV
jgi:hypothetical protein